MAVAFWATFTVFSNDFLRANGLFYVVIYGGGMKRSVSAQLIGSETKYNTNYFGGQDMFLMVGRMLD